MAKWHIMTTYDGTRGSTNIDADSPPVFDHQSNIWSFSRSNQSVLLIPRENVLYIKQLDD